MENKNIDIGRKIFLLRYERFYSQVDFSKKLQVIGLDIDAVTLLNIEKGRRNLLAKEIPYFAKALNMSINEFVEKIFEK